MWVRVLCVVRAGGRVCYYSVCVYAHVYVPGVCGDGLGCVFVCCVGVIAVGGCMLLCCCAMAWCSVVLCCVIALCLAWRGVVRFRCVDLVWCVGLWRVV